VTDVIPLPKQDEFLSLKATHNLLVSGYGFGKTETKLIALLMDMSTYGKYNPTFTIYDPTYDLLNLNTLPRLLEKFELSGIKYSLNKQEKIIRTDGYGQIFLRSMDAPNRIVAYQSFRAYIDELETLRPKQIVDVWNKINGRNRQAIPNAKNRTYTFTTPDAGFGFTYEKWGKATDKSQFDYVCASTTDNPHLPDDYVSNLLAIYPEGMVKAFIHGMWTNIAQGIVYTEYDRHNCYDKPLNVSDDEMLVIGQDFNIGAAVSIVGVMRKGVLYIVGEFVSQDTFSIRTQYNKRYKNKATIYPDASGNQRSTNSTTTDVHILQNDGFRVEVSGSNPRINERVLCVNSAFKQGKLKIDHEACPRLASALEKQAYSETGEPEKSNTHPSDDDYSDALGYLVYKLLPIRKPVTRVDASW
jgi:hypothetical protein